MTSNNKSIECPDRATPMLNDKVNEAFSGDISPRLFNFNLNSCFDSTTDGHLEFIEVLTTDANIFLDKKAKTLAWGTKVPRVETGIQLRLSTVPGVVYHVFCTGQLFLGNKVFLRIKNRNPIIYLSQEVTWKIGNDESKSFCFRALSHQTDLIIFTPTDCVQPLAPFGFTLKYLSIIPDCIMCKGYIEGPTGLPGPAGPAGPEGNPGHSAKGTTGAIGSTGTLGPSGSTGPLGP